MILVTMPEVNSLKKPSYSSKFENTTEYHLLQEKIRRLKRQEQLAWRQTQTIEAELHKTLSERDQLKRKYLRVKEQLTQINGTPHHVATVEKVLSISTNPRAIVKLSTGQEYLCHYPQFLKLNPGDTVALHHHSMNIVEILPKITDPEAFKFIIQDVGSTEFKDIGGLENALLQVRESIEISLTNPELFSHFNIRIPTGVLLHGKPGTGKTLIAKAVAHASHAKFYNITGPELVKKYIGEGARMIREIFHLARQEHGSTIIFIDEIDAIAAKRTGEDRTGEREVNRTLMQLLTELDGFQSNEKIRILAATNRIDILDPAILRPGRFDRIIELPVPNLQGRKTIFQIHTRGMPLYHIDLKDLAALTDGWTGAEIQSLCSEAAIRALRAHLRGEKRDFVKFEDFQEAIKQITTQKGENFTNPKPRISEKIYA